MAEFPQALYRLFSDPGQAMVSDSASFLASRAGRWLNVSAGLAREPRRLGYAEHKHAFLHSSPQHRKKASRPLRYRDPRSDVLIHRRALGSHPFKEEETSQAENHCHSPGPPHRAIFFVFHAANGGGAPT